MNKSELSDTAGQWFYVCCFCTVAIYTGSGVSSSAEPECDFCHNTNSRFVHVLEHEESGKQIQLGIDCARKLVDPSDSEIPTLAENETKRKERWRREKYHTPGRCVTTMDDLKRRGKL